MIYLRAPSLTWQNATEIREVLARKKKRVEPVWLLVGRMLVGAPSISQVRLILYTLPTGSHDSLQEHNQAGSLLSSSPLVAFSQCGLGKREGYAKLSLAKHCNAMSHESALTSNLFWHFRSWCARRPSWTWNQSILGYFSATGWNLERVCLQHSRKELATSLAHLTNFCVRIVL